jgi:nucleoside 2-deoxyribosyltransferase
MAAGTTGCPICDLNASFVHRSPRYDRDVDDVECARCGKFMFAPAHISFDWDSPVVPPFLIQKGLSRRDAKQASLLLRRYLSIYARECSERGLPAPLINPFNLDELARQAETYAFTPVAAKTEKLLRLLEKRTIFPGQHVRLDPELDYPAVHAIGVEEFGFYLQALQKEGSLEYGTTSVPGETKAVLLITITLQGWQRLAATGVNSRTGFIAMSFGASMDSAFSEAIEPAIREAGYEPLRVDRVHHNQKICDRIVVEIRRSRFLIADVTAQSQNVYFEAGFAMALGLPVIWCCRKDDFTNVKFDTRQYNHIVWSDTSQLRSQLHDRIIATIGRAQ